MKKIISIVLSVFMVISIISFVSISSSAKVSHQYRWTVIQKPTYFKEGKRKGKCVDCGKKVVKSIKKLKLQKPKNLSCKYVGVYQHKASWSKVKDASGYVVRTLEDGFDEGEYFIYGLPIKVKSKNKTSVRFEGKVARGFKVRAYKTKGGKKVYSKWSRYIWDDYYYLQLQQ